VSSVGASTDLTVGVDGGGTKTTAVLIDCGGLERGRAAAGPCNIARMPVDAAVAAVRGAVGLALSAAGESPERAPARAGIAVAGYTARASRDALAAALSALWPNTRVTLLRDCEAAWMGATEGRPGVVVCAGTGAVVFGVDHDGREARADGHGFALGDRGSAYAIGRAAVSRYLARCLEQRAPDSLDRLVLAAASAHDADDVVHWVYDAFDPARIARLGGEVAAACESVRAARSLASRAMRDLARSTCTVVRRLNWAGGPAPVYLAGGLWRASAGLRALYETQLDGLRGRMPVEVREALRDPAYGAALRALRNCADR